MCRRRCTLKPWLRVSLAVALLKKGSFRNETCSHGVLEPGSDRNQGEGEPFHAPFNAALLHTATSAYPNIPVTFKGFSRDVEVVKGILQRNAPQVAERVHWTAIKPLKSQSLPSRWIHNRSMIEEALRSEEYLLFTGISRLQLLQLKSAMGSKHHATVTFHGYIDSLEHPPKDRFPKSLFSMHRVLKQHNPAGLRYLFLSESIWRNIPPEFQQAMTPAAVIDHPYNFAHVNVSTLRKEFVFGIFGNNGDGRLLESVARAVKQQNPDIRFRLVGFVQDEETVSRLAPFVEEVGSKPISRELFVQRAKSVTHALWLAPVDSYRLRASGKFFDALAFGTPFVYTATRTLICTSRTLPKWVSGAQL